MGQELPRPRSVVRGPRADIIREPEGPKDHTSYRYIADGIVLAEGGRVVRVDDAQAILKDLPADTRVDHFPTGLMGKPTTRVHLKPFSRGRMLDLFLPIL